MRERTYAENLENATRAMALVENGYLVSLGMPFHAGELHKRFHFVGPTRWSYYLRHVARFRVPKNEADKVEAVTHSYQVSPKIGINEKYHTFETLVHESVHYYSHRCFRRSFTTDTYEGATEYLARNLLGDFGPRRDMFGKNDLYANELSPFLSVIEDEKDLEHLCVAYFCGHQDSIDHVHHRLKRLVSPEMEGSRCP